MFPVCKIERKKKSNVLFPYWFFVFFPNCANVGPYFCRTQYTKIEIKKWLKKSKSLDFSLMQSHQKMNKENMYIKSSLFNLLLIESYCTVIKIPLFITILAFRSTRKSYIRIK